MKDPVVEELHEIRLRMAKECDFDFGRLVEKEREFFRQWKGKKVSHEEAIAWAKWQERTALVAEGNLLRSQSTVYYFTDRTSSR